MEHDEFDREFRPVFDAVRSGKTQCPDNDLLVGYAAEQLDPEQTAFVAAHLAVCAVCEDLMERVRQPAPEPDAVTLRRIEKNLNRRPAPWRETAKTGFWVRLLVPAAAVLLVGVWISVNRDPVMRPESITRGEVVQPLAPVDRVEIVDVFRWQALPIASNFRIEIREQEGLIWEAVTPASSYEPPPELQQRLRPGVRFRWRALALDANGQVFAESRWVEFERNPQ